MFRDILVAVDGSAHAERALEEAIDLARLDGGSLTLVTVVPELSGWFVAVGAGLPPPGDFAQLREDLIREYRQMLARAEARVPNRVSSNALLLEGRVGEAIVGQVHAGGHDLVAMGSRGRGELRSMVLGSVSHQVLHDSPVPVLIVHLKEDQHGMLTSPSQWRTTTPSTSTARPRDVSETKGSSFLGRDTLAACKPVSWVKRAICG